MTKASHQTPAQTNTATAQAEQPTFLEHIIELRTRLFWVIACILLASGVGYGIQNQLIHILVRPLGQQQLFYLTPVGGLAFVFKICFYFGIVLAVPAIVYHLYRYCEPLMPVHHKRMVAKYVTASIVLAAGGVLFAYFFSLPAALHFLTGFHLEHITAMLTIDSYMTFVTTYLLGAAALFQIPLVLLIIDNITPLKPGKLMSYQRYVVLGSFIIAAMISPTPDMFNQTILAVPIIVMYQIGLVMIWRKHRKAAKKQRLQRIPANSAPVDAPSPAPDIPRPQQLVPAPVPVATRAAPQPMAKKVIPKVAPKSAPVFSDIKPVAAPANQPAAVRIAARPLPQRSLPGRTLQYRQPIQGRPTRLAQPRPLAIDGFTPR